MMLKPFAGIVKTILKRLPKNDYPVLNTRLFVLIWLHLIFDKSLGSLRDLFFRLNHQGIAVDLSTFSKASKNRDYQAFNQIYLSLNHELIYAIDSTSRLFGLDQSPLRSTLTSKLFWMSAYHQMKLVMLLDTETGSIAFLIHKRYIPDPEQLNQQRFKCAAQMREPLYINRILDFTV